MTNEGCVAKSAREPQVQDQISRLDSSVAELEAQLTYLEQKCEPVRAAQPCCDKEDKGVVSLVPIASELFKLRMRIDSVANKMGALRGEIEL